MRDDEDVPLTVDFRIPEVTAKWVAEADVKRPWRTEVRARIAGLLRHAGAKRILELGPGPGLLAEVVLGANDVEHYTLFDFAPPMLALCRERLGGDPRVTYVVGDFTQPGWTARLAGPFDAIVAMQSAHEVRHKRHLPRLYADGHALVRCGGLLLVCDHAPLDASDRARRLAATIEEQAAAFATAGFEGFTTHLELERMYVCSAARP